ncbi:right-handed parallel beta-helix repeat-containing protein [Wenzhouxiangella sp. EGI_FJ10409]|uniref:right-handed parallel beta-helix repeat-containing protein n=1 Tax=Wenzhouxiangella sp. EGI_FJ10409 TaxID=3243767 RepID=UPI0035E36C71
MKEFTIALIAHPARTGLALVALLLLAAPALAQQTRYVAVGGSDAGDCSNAGAPCLTIQYAIDQADGGDTVSVGAGSYAEAPFIDKSLTLLSESGAASTTIEAGGVDNAISIGDVEGAFDPKGGVYPDNVRVEGFTVVGWTRRGIAQRLGTGTIEIIDNVVEATEGVTTTAIAVAGGTGSVISGNLIQVAAATRGESSSSILAIGSDNASIFNNTVAGGDIGIALAGSLSSTDPGWAQSNAVEVENNTISDTSTGIALQGNVVDALIEFNEINGVAGRAISQSPFDDPAIVPDSITIADNTASEFGSRGFSSGQNPMSDSIIRDNDFTSTVADAWGIQIGEGSSNILIEGNQVSTDAPALNLRGMIDSTVFDNELTGNVAGVVIQQGGHANNELTANLIDGGVVVGLGGNTDGAVLRDNHLAGTPMDIGVFVQGDADTSGGPLDATCNWWDSATGPAGEGNGGGSSVSQNIEFLPWNLTAGGDCRGGLVAEELVAASPVTISGLAGQPVAPADLPTAQVLDQFGDPLAGTTVGFEITAGDGSIGGTVQVSDNDGLVQLGSWTLGSAATQEVSASAPGLTGSPVAFVADVEPVVELGIGITDSRSTIDAGEQNTYIITADNSGPSAAEGAEVSVSFPPQLDPATATWTCSAGPGSACTAFGSGEIADNAVEIAAGGSVTYVLEVDVRPDASGLMVVPAEIVAGDETASDFDETGITGVVDEVFQDRFEVQD